MYTAGRLSHRFGWKLTLQLRICVIFSYHPMRSSAVHLIQDAGTGLSITDNLSCQTFAMTVSNMSLHAWWPRLLIVFILLTLTTNNKTCKHVRIYVHVKIYNGYLSRGCVFARKLCGSISIHFMSMDVYAVYANTIYVSLLCLKLTACLKLFRCIRKWMFN